MLWRILIDGAQMGWVEQGTGFLWDDDGDRIHRGIGYETLDTDPPQPKWYKPTPVQLIAQVVARRLLKRQAFRDRFKEAELVKLQRLSVDNSASSEAIRDRQARLRVFLQMMAADEKINIESAFLRNTVAALEGFGVLPVGRAAEILDLNVAPDEAAENA